MSSVWKGNFLGIKRESVNDVGVYDITELATEILVLKYVSSTSSDTTGAVRNNVEYEVIIIGEVLDIVRNMPKAIRY